MVEFKKLTLLVMLLCVVFCGAFAQNSTASVIPDSAVASIDSSNEECKKCAEIQRVEKGNLVIECVPEIPDDLNARLQQYQNVRSAGFSGWDAKGKGVFISTRFGETGQIHYVAMPGGARTQLTFFDEPVGGASVRPSPNTPGFLFRKDVGGGENYQIYYFDQTDGSIEMLTDGKSQNSGVVWNRDGSEFLFVSNKRNGKDYDIYMTNMKDPKSAEMIYQGEGSWGAGQWSPDNSKIILSNYISATQSRTYIMDLATKKMTMIQDATGELSMGAAVWRYDGKKIYFVSDYYGEFSLLQQYDLETGKSKLLTKKLNWDVEALDMSPDGKILAFTTNENGSYKLYLMNTLTNWFAQVEALPIGIIGGIEFSPDASKLAMTLMTPDSPGDVYSYELKTKKLTRWTFSETGGLNPNNFIIPQFVYYPSKTDSDSVSLNIPAYYFKPKGEGPFPVIIYLHGGPEGQYMPYFSSAFQYWLNEMGIAVLCPNVRGSTGYGKTFTKMDNWYKRENSVADAGALLDWIAKQPELNPEKVAVIGGSYGGYMVLAMMTHYPERLACAVDMVGISNFVTFLENTSPYRQDLRRVEYGDERIPEMREFLLNISPAMNADKIKKPLFVAQGLNDPRVPASEAEQIVAAARLNCVEVWYLLAKDEGHGFAKKTNRDYYNAAVVLFFREFLLK